MVAGIEGDTFLLGGCSCFAGYFTSMLRSAALQKKKEEEEAVVRWEGSIKGLEGARQGVQVGYDQDIFSKNKNYS